jgi:hemerythrin
MLIDKINPVAFDPMNEIHNNELKYVNTLYEALEKNENVKNAYEDFINDVKNHFAFEEKLMDKYKFFATIPHKMEHQRILNELLQLQTRLDDRELIKNYLKNIFIPWLENHVNTMDTVTAGFFKMVNATI